MNKYLKKRHANLGYRIISIFILLAFTMGFVLPPQASFAQSILNLPLPGTMIHTSVRYTPAFIRGMTIYPENPLQFDFIVDIGDDHLQGEALRKESKKLINYFMATLTVPEEEMWVNLSPYEKNRIIAEGLSYTEMGRDMLAQDYMLKQLAASLMYPEEGVGSEFWKRVYAKAQEKFGTTDIPTNTFNKIWIVPEEAVVYVNGNNVFIAESHLNVMLEEDYLSLENNVESTKHGLGNITKDELEEISGISKQILREVLLPEIEKEVNEGKNFANLRQIYSSMILATWYKKNLKESLLGKIYMNQNKIEGIDIEEKDIKDKIYNQYVEAFKKGVYDYIKEDYDLEKQKIIPRKYFSGGLERVPGAREDRTVSRRLSVAQVMAERAHAMVRSDGAMISKQTLELEGGELRTVANVSYIASKAARPDAKIPAIVKNNDKDTTGNLKITNIKPWTIFEVNLKGQARQELIAFAISEKKRFDENGRSVWESMPEEERKKLVDNNQWKEPPADWVGPPRILLMSEEEMQQLEPKLHKTPEGFVIGDNAFALVGDENRTAFENNQADLLDNTGDDQYMRVSGASLARIVVEIDGVKYYVLQGKEKQLTKKGRAHYQPFGGHAYFTKKFMDEKMQEFGIVPENENKADEMAFYMPKRNLSKFLELYDQERATGQWEYFVDAVTFLWPHRFQKCFQIDSLPLLRYIDQILIDH